MTPEQITDLVREQGPYVFDRMFGAMEKVRERIVDLRELVRMKLLSNRDKDRVHVRDMIGVGLIDATWPADYEPPLGQRLQTLIDDPDG